MEVSKAIGMKMLITVPSFDVKDKSVSEIKEKQSKDYAIYLIRLEKILKFHWNFVGLQIALLISLEQHMM